MRVKGLFSGRPSMASARQTIHGREPLKETLYSHEGSNLYLNRKPQNSNCISITNKDSLFLKFFQSFSFLRLRLSLILFLFLCGGACKNLQRVPHFQVEFLNEQILKKGLIFQGLPVGGLSALVFDKDTGEFLALSDDKLNHRFYRLELRTPPRASDTDQKKEKVLPLLSAYEGNEQKAPLTFQFIFKKQIFLQEKNSTRLKRNMDPEGIGLKNQSLFIASEGQQIFNPPEPPQVFTFTKTGVLKTVWPIPPVFWNEDKLSFFGTRENKGFEALTLTGKYLWIATEKSLRQDPDRLLRLSGFGLEKGTLHRQYPYFLESKAGLTEMIAITNRIFLTLERAYNKQMGTNQVRLFKTNCRKATNLITQGFTHPDNLKFLSPALTSSGKKLKLKNPEKSDSVIPCDKTLIVDFFKLPAGVTVDNLEGMALGPDIPGGGQLLVFTSDNNFSASQKTQFLFFRISTL